VTSTVTACAVTASCVVIIIALWDSFAPKRIERKRENKEKLFVGGGRLLLRAVGVGTGKITGKRSARRVDPVHGNPVMRNENRTANPFVPTRFRFVRIARGPFNRQFGEQRYCFRHGERVCQILPNPLPP